MLYNDLANPEIKNKMNLKKFITIEIEENNRCDLIKKIIYFSKKYNFNLDYVIINKNDSCKKKSYYKNIYGDFWRKKLFNNYLNLNKLNLFIYNY